MSNLLLLPFHYYASFTLRLLISITDRWSNFKLSDFELSRKCIMAFISGGMKFLKNTSYVISNPYIEVVMNEERP